MIADLKALIIAVLVTKSKKGSVETEAVLAETEAIKTGKCMKQSVINAVRFVNCRLCRQVRNQFIAATVLKKPATAKVIKEGLTTEEAIISVKKIFTRK